jgi:ABC-type polysaccharide/polyol phosphate export permease
MTISIKFGWSRALWIVLERNFKIKHTIAFYFILLIIFGVIVQYFCRIIGVNYRDANLILLPLGFAFMPPLAKISK